MNARHTDPIGFERFYLPRKEASIEIGRRACDIIVDGMIRKARELISSEN